MLFLPKNAKLSLNNSLWPKLRKDIGMITSNVWVYFKKGGGKAEEQKKKKKMTWKFSTEAWHFLILTLDCWVSVMLRENLPEDSYLEWI